MAYTVVGIFDSQQQIRPAIEDLLAAGVEQDQISYLSADASAAQRAEPVATETAAGALLGGVSGLLVGLGTLAIPGIGPILAAGPLATALIGAGVGATGGAVLAALQGAGVPEAEARELEERVRTGSIVVTVTVDDTLADPVSDILERHGAHDVGETRQTSVHRYQK